MSGSDAFIWRHLVLPCHCITKVAFTSTIAVPPASWKSSPWLAVFSRTTSRGQRRCLYLEFTRWSLPPRNLSGMSLMHLNCRLFCTSRSALVSQLDTVHFPGIPPQLRLARTLRRLETLPFLMSSARQQRSGFSPWNEWLHVLLERRLTFSKIGSKITALG